MGRNPKHESGDRPTPRLLDPKWQRFGAASPAVGDLAEPAEEERRKRAAREEAERTANNARGLSGDLWELVARTLRREMRLRRALERLRLLDDQGVDLSRPSSNIGRVLHLRNLRGPGWSWRDGVSFRAALDLIAQDAAAYARPLGDEVSCKITIPLLIWVGTLYRDYDGKFVAPRTEVEIVAPGPESPETRVEILEFECVRGHDLMEVMVLVECVAHDIFGEGVRLRINGLLPNAPEGATRKEILDDAVRRNRDVTPDAPEGAEPWELLDETFGKNHGGISSWSDCVVRDVTVEVVK